MKSRFLLRLFFKNLPFLSGRQGIKMYNASIHITRILRQLFCVLASFLITAEIIFTASWWVLDSLQIHKIRLFSQAGRPGTRGKRLALDFQTNNRKDLCAEAVELCSLWYTGLRFWHFQQPRFLLLLLFPRKVRRFPYPGNQRVLASAATKPRPRSHCGERKIKSRHHSWSARPLIVKKKQKTLWHPG